MIELTVETVRYKWCHVGIHINKQVCISNNNNIRLGTKPIMATRLAAGCTHPPILNSLLHTNASVGRTGGNIVRYTGRY